MSIIHYPHNQSQVLNKELKTIQVANQTTYLL